MRNGQRVTIVDVAERVGVHAGTVSRALNRPEQVAPETRARVEAAVLELGFVPNRAARGGSDRAHRLLFAPHARAAILTPVARCDRFAAGTRCPGGVVWNDDR